MHGPPDQHFCKPPLSLDEQLRLLESRGLQIAEPRKAIHYLQFIGYYRLSGYFHAFYERGLSPSHTFAARTTFKTVLEAYILDRELRILVMDAIERIEVAFRACISNTLCLHHGAHWFLDPKHFVSTNLHEEILEKIKNELMRRDKEEFISHYFKTYCHPELPPSWMVVEVISLGTLSRIYSKLADRSIQKAICKPFGINHYVIESWLHALAYLRNLCAHHATLWNRTFSIKPTPLRSLQKLMSRNDKFFAQAVMLYTLMRVIADGSRWQHRLASLLEKHSIISSGIMGFPSNWKEDPFWNLA